MALSNAQRQRNYIAPASAGKTKRRVRPTDPLPAEVNGLHLEIIAIAEALAAALRKLLTAHPNLRRDEAAMHSLVSAVDVAVGVLEEVRPELDARAARRHDARRRG